MKSELSSPPPLVGIQRSLSTLRVTHAKLTSVPATYFSGCDKLSTLVLNHNQLNTLPDLSAISDTLYSIELDHNNLTDVRPLQDFSFPNLRYVFLSHNQILQVDISRFHLPRLHAMVLSHNLIREFGDPRSLVRGGDKEVKEVEIHLRGNPWYCNHKLSWVTSALQMEYHYSDAVDLYWKGFTVQVISAQDMICHYPASVRGTPAIYLGRYSISQEICTRFCCALLCCGYAIVHNEFTWSIYPYSSGLLCWHWGNR